jgi:hypothetical protein
MTENKTKSLQVRAGPRLFRWLKEQQYAYFLAGKRKPTYEELLEDLLDMAQGKSKPVPIRELAEDKPKAPGGQRGAAVEG